MVIGLAVLALCVLGLPAIAQDGMEYFSAAVFLPVLIVLYVAAVPFYFALYQALRLLSYIDKSIAFSELSVRALKMIKYCAFAISILFAAISPLLLHMADQDDAPGLLAIGLIIVAASLVIGVFAAVLQMLLKEAIDIKSENDLTV
nr:DUF2975 domain-containing protein [Cohnella lubricantis]